VKPSYSTNNPKGWCGNPARGAALGRTTIKKAPPDFNGKLYLSRIRMSGDYDCNGTYFGYGILYWVANEDLSIDYVVRADTRALVKAEVLTDYPNARFFR
jgi:hypothetical protein